LVVAASSTTPKAPKTSLWHCDPATGAVRRTLEVDGWTETGWLAPDGRRLACLHEKSVHVYGSAEGNELFRVPINADGPQVAFAPDGKSLALGGGMPAVRVHDSTTGRVVFELTIPDKRTTGIVYSPDGRLLVVSSCGDRFPGHATVWEPGSGKLV